MIFHLVVFLIQITTNVTTTRSLHYLHVVPFSSCFFLFFGNRPTGSSLPSSSSPAASTALFSLSFLLLFSCSSSFSIVPVPLPFIFLFLFFLLSFLILLFVCLLRLVQVLFRFCWLSWFESNESPLPIVDSGLSSVIYKQHSLFLAHVNPETNLVVLSWRLDNHENYHSIARATKWLQSWQSRKQQSMMI